MLSTLLALALVRVSSAQSLPATPGQPSVQIDATALVRRAVQHRIDTEKNHRPLRYLLHRADERHDTTKEIV